MSQRISRKKRKSYRQEGTEFAVPVRNFVAVCNEAGKGGVHNQGNNARKQTKASCGRDNHKTIREAWNV